MAVMQLEFGRDEQWEAPAREGIASYLKCNLPPVEDLKAAVDQALTNPVEFPSLDQAVVAGDTLAIAVDPRIADGPVLVEQVLRWFIDHGTLATNIRVVLAGEPSSQISELCARIQSQLPQGVEIEIHDPDNPEAIAYVAATESADPIYLNRTVVDADVVIPLVAGQPSTALEYFGAFSLFPLLTDRKTRSHFSHFDQMLNHRDELSNWAEQAAWWAGFVATIVAVPAGRNRVGGIVAGLTESVEGRVRETMTSAWGDDVAPQELVVVLLDDPVHDAWASVAQALYAADQMTQENGSIVICSQIDEEPTATMQALCQSDLSTDQLRKQFAKVESGDTAIAELLIKCTESKHVYLASALNAEIVEALGLGVVSSASELSHLIEQFESVALVNSIQHRELTA